jgi:hypothetical protein
MLFSQARIYQLTKKHREYSAKDEKVLIVLQFDQPEGNYISLAFDIIP